ncbi:MAG TPA: hypothetical protein VG013_17515 [Gemmataceae bacterium]|jgi:hypothetical protein|nr:hypothetical protein [Gemmataceae bacterium]
MLLFTWDQLELQHYLAVGGGVIAVVAVVCYFGGGARIRVPAAAAGFVGAVAAGFGLGVITMVACGYHWNVAPVTTPTSAGAGTPGGGMAGGGMGGGGTPRSAPAGRDRAPTARDQLVSLVDKLNLLLLPLDLELTAKQKALIRQQLKSIPQSNQLSDDEAKAKLDVLHDTLKYKRGVLSLVGYDWTEPVGGKGGGKGEKPLNPFMRLPAETNLRSLQERLAK